MPKRYDEIAVEKRRHGVLRAVSIAAAMAALGLVSSGCGSVGDGHSTASSARVGAGATAPVAVLAAARGPLEGDEDDDDGPGEERGQNPHDPDVDGDNDMLKQSGYYDRDDREFRTWGHAASGAERAALTGLVERYYATAASGNGTGACGMLTPEVAKAVPEDFGHGSVGPAYLRSATTCPQVLTLLFEHSHTRVSTPIRITATRVRGEQGLILFGAHTQPASYLEASHLGGVWLLTGMLASALP